MVSNNVDENVDGRSGVEVANSYVVGVETASFVFTKSTKGITANAALAFVVLPLDFNSAAEQFAVLVVGFDGEAKSPHGVSGGRFHHTSVASHRARHGEEKGETGDKVHAVDAAEVHGEVASEVRERKKGRTGKLVMVE